MRETICRTPVRVRYEEADVMGIAYYGTYFDWFTLGRSELLRSVELPYRDRFELHGLFLPVVETGCTYRRPSPLDAEVEVETRVRLRTPTRLDFTYRILLRPEGTPAAEGFTRHAYVGADGRPVDLRRRDPALWEALTERIGTADEGAPGA